MIQNVKEALQTHRIFVLLVAMGLFAMAARDVTDPDVWWHLRTGELITDTHSVPHTDPYSFTRFGQPWINHEWLSDVLIFGLYRAGGWAGLIVVFAAISAATFMLAYARSPGRTYMAGAVTVWGAVASAPTWGVRPQTLSLLLASVLLFILDKAESQHSLAWLTIPLTLLWVNLHAGYALGIALPVLYVAGYALEYVVGSQSWLEAAPKLRSLLLATLGCIAVIPLNPNGVRMYAYPWDTLRSEAMQSYISEWFSPNFHQYRFLAFLFMVLAVFVATATARRVRARDLLLLAATLWGALHSIRHIPVFVLVAIPVVSLNIREWWQSGAQARTSSSRVKLAFNAVLIVTFVTFTLVRVRTVVSHQPDVEAEHFPAAAVAYIAKHQPPAPMISHYNWGGYLIWRLYPNYRVFIDGRADVYGDELMNKFREVMYLGGKGSPDLDSWDIKTALLPPDTPLTQALRLSNDWTEIYKDAQAVIFVRKKGT